MDDDRPFTKNLGWRVYLIGALILLVVVTLGGQWWIARPKRSAERFISLLSEGQFRQASELLRDPSAIQTDATGNVMIKARDGATARLSQAELPLVAHGYRADEDWVPRTGTGDYLAGRYRFQVSTSGPALKGGQKKPVVVFCISETGRIAIETLREHASQLDHGMCSFFVRELEPDKVPGIDYGAVAYAFIHDEPGFIIWSDFPSGAMSYSINRRGSVSLEGNFAPEDGARVDFKFEGHDGKTGNLTIHGREYKCADGRLFLIRDGREVKQLNRELKELEIVRQFIRRNAAIAALDRDERDQKELSEAHEALANFARRDPEISSFYGADTQQSGTSNAP